MSECFVRYKRITIARIVSDIDAPPEHILGFECPRALERFGRDIDARGRFRAGLKTVDDEGLIELIEGTEHAYSLEVDGEAIGNISLIMADDDDVWEIFEDQYPSALEHWKHLELAVPLEGVRRLSDDEIADAIEEALKRGDGE